MKKIMLAVGYRALEEFIQEQLKNDYEFVGVTVYREGIIKMVEQKNPDIIIMREALEGKESWLNIIYRIRAEYPNIRIIFIAGKREPGDAFLSTLVSYSVYDIIYGETINAFDIINLIRKPNTFADVKHLSPVLMYDEKTNKLLFESPEPIVQEKEIIKEVYIDNVNEENVEKNNKKNNFINLKPNNFIKLKNKDEAEPKTLSYKKQQIISFIGSKNGLGTTSVAINTAVLLSNQNYKVLYIELDDKFPSISYLYDLSKVNDGIDTALKYLLEQKYNKIRDAIIKMDDVKNSNINSEFKKIYEKFPDKIDFLFFSQSYTILNDMYNFDYIKYADQVKDLYFYLLMQEGYDFIIIDCKTDIKRKDILSSLIFSNKIITILTQDVSSIGYTLYLFDELSKKNVNIKDKNIYVINKYENTLLSYKDIINWIQVDYAITIPNFYQDFINSNYIGLPVVLNSKNKQLIDSFNNLITNILK